MMDERASISLGVLYVLVCGSLGRKKGVFPALLSGDATMEMHLCSDQRYQGTEASA